MIVSSWYIDSFLYYIYNVMFAEEVPEVLKLPAPKRGNREDGIHKDGESRFQSPAPSPVMDQQRALIHPWGH